ncbi:hypothetical protein Ddye_011927 [Dipteronia dyeriana]|uniref:Uncharacterized protein n=1 Tax=Dipteronia dyeriana TaxID=168575 RepID=A0AAD9X3F2_9ROSI|nr:hypothetical protein Ddye_011927 [Dipteronia dyeriana]
MKFGKEFDCQMVPEWQEAYMDYDLLKTFLKEIQWIKQRNKQAADATGAASLTRALTLYRAYSGLVMQRHEHNHPMMMMTSSPSMKDIESSIVMNSVNRNGSHSYETTFLMATTEDGGEYEQEFFSRLDNEFNRVDKFYRFKVQEVMEEAETLSRQMEALIAFRIKALALQEALFDSMPSDDDDDDPLDVLDHVELHNTVGTPYSIIRRFVNSTDQQKQVTFNIDTLKKVETKLKRAFIQFYHKIGLLKSYSFLNILAFSKIMKKYDKIASRSELSCYMNMVDNSYIGSSDEVTKLMERVEVAFIKHFSNSNRRKGMNILRPKAKKEAHIISFFTGIFCGCTVALILALIIIIRARHLLNKEGHNQYMENMFPLYSFFAFIFLHIVMYAGNIYYWRRYRINYSFIFGFKQGTALGYMDVLLVSFGVAVLALTSVLRNLDMEMDPKTNDYKALTELLPLGLVLLVIIIVICPLNILYRSSRFFVLSSLFHCICAPLYKVALQDFFLADQLTSQVQAFRSLEFYICYYGWGDYKLRQNTCKTNDVYNTFYIIVAIIPYWWRFLQCIRRVYEEKDKMQGYNAVKYFMTIVAISTRSAYSLYMGMGWKIIAEITSVIAAIYCTYWDLVVDWGLLQRHSKNRWLRDKLLVPCKTLYFAAMVLNVFLRFAWLQTVLDLKLGFLHEETVITIFASLEIIRRGIWNFFRLENEHLNNVGKYRAFKSVPLPFKYYEHEDRDE